MRHEFQHLAQHEQHARVVAIALVPVVGSTFSFCLSMEDNNQNISLMSQIMTRMKDPKAREPRWYLMTLFTALNTGKPTASESSSELLLWEKYHLQTDEAIMKYCTAMKKANPHRPPKMKIPSSDHYQVVSL